MLVSWVCSGWTMLGLARSRRSMCGGSMLGLCDVMEAMLGVDGLIDGGVRVALTWLLGLSLAFFLR